MTAGALARAIGVGLLAAAMTPGAITLPASRRLAGPIDDAKSAMGDAITNYPFGSGFGSVNIHGWMSVDFDVPSGRTSRFRVRWSAIGDLPLFAFASGHFLRIFGEQTFNSAIQVSQGDLNLDTGEVTNLEVHAIFQNILIHKSAKYDRLPLLSDGSGFSALFVDFPPLEYPFELPVQAPPTSQRLTFTTDANQRITGMEFRGTTFVPITVLPALGILPPYAFVRGGVTIVPGADGCLPGTVPPSQCLSEDRLPDGIDAPANAYLAPIFNLVSSELREEAVPPLPPASPSGALAGSAAASLNGLVYVTGGHDGERASSTATVFDPSRNEWTRLPDLPRAVARHCMAAAGSKVYSIGGHDGSRVVSSVAVLDPASRTWSTAAALPAPSADGACAAIGNRIFWFGGETPSGVSGAAWVFDTATGQWSGLPPLPVPLAGAAAAAAGNEIWAINGTADGSTATNRVFVFSPASGSWREGPPSIRGVHGASASWLDGRLYVAGGRTQPGGPLDLSPVVYYSQTVQLLAQGVWHEGLHPPMPASGMAGAVAGGTWYLVGGDTASTSPAAPTGVVRTFGGGRGWAASNSYPAFTAQTVRNAAGLGVGPAALAPGTLASILGDNLAPRSRTAPPVRTEGRYLTTDLPDELEGVTVSVGGRPAGIVSVSPTRVDFQVPFDVAPQGAVEVRVAARGTEGAPARVEMAPSAPGIYTYTFGEARLISVLDGAAAIVRNQDGTLNHPSRPAHRGETVTLRVTGLGDVDPRPAPLQRGPRQPAAVTRTPEVLIDGRPAAVQSAVLTPGEAGLYDVKVTIPADARTGVRVTVQLGSGGILSNLAVMVIE